VISMSRLCYEDDACPSVRPSVTLVDCDSMSCHLLCIICAAFGVINDDDDDDSAIKSQSQHNDMIGGVLGWLPACRSRPGS